MAVEDDLLEVLEVRVVDESPEIGAVRRRDCGDGWERREKKREENGL